MVDHYIFTSGLWAQIHVQSLRSTYKNISEKIYLDFLRRDKKNNVSSVNM
jgi:hypothetical protein